jgi:hypothetical protein
MGFESDLVARQVGDVDWELVEPLKYRGNTELFEVPAETKTDFASVPAFFQWLIPRSGRYTRAAVLHDYLLRSVPGLSRADADGIFRRAMAELKVPFLRRWLMWAAVRLYSLFRSAFRDGPRDIPRVLLLVLLPGLPIIMGGLLVLVLLLGFWAFEILVLAVLSLFGLAPAVRKRIKPTNRPTVLWSP